MGCVSGNPGVFKPRSPLVRDVESYAMASCLTAQADPLLKDQGDGWAWVIMQRMKGELEVFTTLGAKVSAVVAKGDMAVIPTD